MKYAYKMIMLDNETLWKDIGIMQGGWTSKNSEEPAEIPFANELGEDGWEMFQVVQYALNSCYYFRKVI